MSQIQKESESLRRESGGERGGEKEGGEKKGGGEERLRGMGGDTSAAQQLEPGQNDSFLLTNFKYSLG